MSTPPRPSHTRTGSGSLMSILSSPLALFSPRLSLSYEPLESEAKAEGSRRRRSGSFARTNIKRVEVKIGGMTVST